MILNLFEMKRQGRQALGVDATLGEAAAGMITERYAPSWFEREARSSLLQLQAHSVGVAHFDIFLSHAYRDKAVVIGTYQKLRNLGFSVYVDWIYDTKIDRSNVDYSTAELLRQRMRQCDSLLYMTTSNSDQSKWMPWECGYFDAHDRRVPNDGHVAILPVLEQTDQTFIGREYLGLYCWTDVDSGARPASRALNIHRAKALYPSVKFDPWVRGNWP